MKKFFNRCALPTILAFLVCFPMIIPAFAFEDSFRDYDSVDDWEVHFNHGRSAFVDAVRVFVGNYGIAIPSTVDACWYVWDIRLVFDFGGSGTEQRSGHSGRKHISDNRKGDEK